MGFGLLTTAGTYVSVGLVSTRINIPLFPFAAREFTYHGSFWGNYNDLSEIVALAPTGKDQAHTLKKVRLEEINENLELLRDGCQSGVLNAANLSQATPGCVSCIRAARIFIPSFCLASGPKTVPMINDLSLT